MVSTYIDYNLLTRDMKTSLQRTAQQTLVARETEYYKANIGNVTSIDEFLGDYRLYAYAMKAHGLEDMTYAKAFMRKVLESDLSDDNSYANMLTDDRYQNFARAFSFSQSTEVVQSDAQEDALIGLYNQSVSNIDTKMVQETRYYDTMMDTITNVDQLLQNDRLRSYTFQVFGVDAKYFNYAQVRGALTSDLNDPNSYFNTNFAPALDAAIATKASSDQALSALSSRVQSQTRITNIDALLARPETSDEDKVTLQAEKTTLQNNIATINAAFPEMTSNIDAYAGVEAEIRDLRTQMNQPDVTEAEKAAFQAEIDERQTALKTMKGVNFYATDLQTKQQESTATIARIAVFKDLALMYDFAADGSVPSGGTAQAADSRKATQEVYAYKAPRATNSVAVLHKAYYEETIANVTTVAQIKGDSRLYSYILTAFGLPSSTTVTMLESILTSDPNDPASYVNTKGGEYNAAYKTLRAAFNFQTDGTLAAGDKPQTAAQIKTTSDNYMVRYNDADEAADATLINSFKSLMKIVSNVDDLIADTKIMKLALTAVGLENESDTARKIRRVLTSDLTDPKSYVYTLKDDRYLQLAKAFNFNATDRPACRCWRRPNPKSSTPPSPMSSKRAVSRPRTSRPRRRRKRNITAPRFRRSNPSTSSCPTGAWSISCLFPPGWIRKKCRPTTSARCFSPISAIRTASSTRSRTRRYTRNSSPPTISTARGSSPAPNWASRPSAACSRRKIFISTRPWSSKGARTMPACGLHSISGVRQAASTPLTIFWPTAPFCRSSRPRSASPRPCRVPMSMCNMPISTGCST